MISAPPADTISVVAPETDGRIKKEDKSDDSFAGLLSAISEGGRDIKTAVGAPEETESAETQKKNHGMSACMEILKQVYQFLGQIKQDAGTEQRETIASAMKTITDILEGNTGDTDIAALPTEVKSCVEQLGSREKEAILARMPQINELFQKPDSAATEEINRICSNLCPLENFSEQTVVQVQTVEAPGTDNGNTDAAEAEVNASGVNTVFMEEKNAENTQSGDNPPDTREAETAPEQANKAEDTLSRSLPDLDGPVAVTAENTAADTPDIVKTAVSDAALKLSDILTSYDEKSSGQFEIRLEPENLGKLSITLSMGEDGLKALIHTKDTQVQSLLASEIGTLVDKLSENGVQIKSLDVVCSDMESGQLGGQNSGNAYSGQRSNSYWRRGPEEIQAAYEDSDSTQTYAWAYEELIGSTVSYRV